MPLTPFDWLGRFVLICIYTCINVNNEGESGMMMVLRGKYCREFSTGVLGSSVRLFNSEV